MYQIPSGYIEALPRKCPEMRWNDGQTRVTLL